MRTVVRIVCAAVLVLAVAGLVSAQSSEPAAKTALLLANSDYTTFGDLANPVPEAREFGEALRGIGFDVMVVANASREDMLDALYEFERKVRQRGGVALVHYGGHGVQVDGENYLIPANADIPDERRVTTRAVSVREIMSTLDASGSETNIVILDACRNNPLPETSTRSAARGLGLVEFKPRNSLLVYAAQPGEVAQDGLFTPTLAERIRTPGLSITQVLQEVRREVYAKSEGEQLPGSYDELLTPVYLAGMTTTDDSRSAREQQNRSESSAPAVTDNRPTVQVERATGTLHVQTEVAGTLFMDGVQIGMVGIGEELTLRNVIVGLRELVIEGNDETVAATASVERDGEVTVLLQSEVAEVADTGVGQVREDAQAAVQPPTKEPPATTTPQVARRQPAFPGTALGLSVGNVPDQELFLVEGSLSWYLSQGFGWGFFGGLPSFGTQIILGDTRGFALTLKGGGVWIDGYFDPMVGVRIDLLGFGLGVD